MYESRKKLNEALFHLKKLKVSQNNTIEEFEIYLNAFLSSARSVTWILNNECSKSECLKNKYEQTSFQKSDKELLDLMTKLRNKSLKIEPIQVAAITYTYKFDIEQSDEWKKITPQKTFYSLEEGYCSDIEIKCEQYYKLLDILVADFENTI